MRTAILYIAARCNQDCVFCLEVEKAWVPFVDPSTIAIPASWSSSMQAVRSAIASSDAAETSSAV